MKRIPAWVWFFIVLAALSALAGTIEIWFNLSQQLTPEQAAAARDLWRQHAPTDYDLTYTLSWQDRTATRYTATIHNREVTAVTVDGQELEPVLYALHDLPPLFDAVTAWLAADPMRRDGTVDYAAPPKGSAKYFVQVHGGETVVERNGQVVPAKLASSYLPAAQLAAIVRHLAIDRQPGAPQAYCVATFHRDTGAVLRFVHSVSATRDRVEIVATEFETSDKR